jgi:hypothetical protein
MGLFRERRDEWVNYEGLLVAMCPTKKGMRQSRLDTESSLTIRVRLPSGERRDLTCVCRVPHDRVPMLNHKLPVRLSPDHSRVEVDFNALPSLVERATAAADAAQRGDSDGVADAFGFRLRGDDQL